MSKTKSEHLIASDVKELVWLRLKRLTSYQLCQDMLASNHEKLETSIINLKAEGLSSSVRSAIGFWETKEGGLNSKILSRYYGLLQLTLAEQIALEDPKINLSYVQSKTEHGHGLFIKQYQNFSFPENLKVGCLTSGHFYSYAKNLNYDIKAHACNKKSEAEQNEKNLISLADLLARVPELQRVISEYINVKPMSFHIGFASKNQTHFPHVGLSSENTTEQKIDGTKTTYVCIYNHDESLTASTLEKLGLEIENFEKEDTSEDNHCFIASLAHPKDDLWWNHIQTHKSDYCGTSIIAPYWGIKDPVLLHLTILYALSIIVRYLPEVWHKIEHGEYDYMKPLLEHYLVIVDNVLPKLALERLTRTKLTIAQPGAMNSLI